MPVPGLRPEKVYLHVDRSYYAAGEQIWFQGYLDGASPETDTSGANIQVRCSGNPLKLLINDGNGNYEVTPLAEGRICAERAFYRYDTRSPRENLLDVPKDAL